jgi:TonB dependent receptor
MGGYIQDEWKITDQITMNAGLRFDQMYQYVDANQLSPRISFTYKPSENTTWHAGYARYFTPPVLVEAVSANIELFRNTTGAPSQFLADPVLPERSHYFDAGVSQKIPLACSSLAPLMLTPPAAGERDCGTLEVGVDAYYKIASDLIDNGNFGQALVGRPRSGSRACERGHFAATVRAARGNPIAHSVSADPLRGPRHAGIGTCRSSCCRSSAPPQSDRRRTGCLPIQAYRRGRICPRAEYELWSGQKLATTLAGRRRQTVAVSRS